MTEGGTNASYRKMESTLTKVEIYCSTSVDGHFPRTMQVISDRTAHSQIAPMTNKPQSSNTADIQQSTNVHCAHHDIQILPHGQRGIRIEQDTSTCFGSKRQTATQKKHTQANSEWLVGSMVGTDSFDLFLPLSPTHGVANNAERYSVKPGPHVRASRPSTQSVASKRPISPRYSFT